jgi:hypothetical protein
MSEDTVALLRSLKKDVNWKKFIFKLIVKSILNAVVKVFIAKLLFDKIKS